MVRTKKSSKEKENTAWTVSFSPIISKIIYDSQMEKQNKDLEQEKNHLDK